MGVLQAIKYDDKQKTLAILDQLGLPFMSEYVEINSIEQAHDAIKRMVVRGAPAIAIVASLALAVELYHLAEKPTNEQIQEKLNYLITARPTAVNLSQAMNSFRILLTKSDPIPTIISNAEQMLEDDISDNKNIGQNGAEWICEQVGKDKFSVLTICNTGSLATAGYGTALGIIRSLHENGNLEHAYCLETRPYNQGSRLTAYELVYDKIPATLICDSMASALLSSHPEIKMIVVGADRVANNGDTANKIGTYQLAIIAKHHGVKFVVAAPTTSIDLNTGSGTDIVIEQRPAHEAIIATGPQFWQPGHYDLDRISTVQTAAEGINIWNPAFDVTPHELIDAIVTEKAVKIKNSKGQFDLRVTK